MRLVPTLVAVALLCVAAGARAIDIPMNPRLADEALDSKTCFGTLASGGKLVGYELGESLLASAGGRLVILTSTDRAEVGDGRTRSYAGNGIRVVVAPHGTARWHPDPAVEEIREKARLTIIERGRRRTLPARVEFTCSP